MMVVFWSLVVFGIIALVRYTARGSEPSLPHERGDGGALRILEERFARGEIDADEYMRRRDVLGRR